MSSSVPVPGTATMLGVWLTNFDSSQRVKRRARLIVRRSR
jgi:hypothetical protein